MIMKNNIHNKKKNLKRGLSFGGIISIVFIAYLVIVGGSNTIENFRLKRSGISTKAIVYNQKHVGSKGVVNTYYEFIVDDKHFQGYSTTEDNAKIGDTLQIVFLKSNPKISRTKSFLGLK
jgi:hypothetical protein